MQISVDFEFEVVNVPVVIPLLVARMPHSNHSLEQ